MKTFKPFVPAGTSLPDFNVKTVILGVVLGALFGSANAYLGLRVGLTISTAIPLAVVSVAILRILTPIFGKPYREGFLLDDGRANVVAAEYQQVECQPEASRREKQTQQQQ